jgi:integrase
MKFTQRIVDSLALPEGKPETIHFDDTLAGFGVRLRSSGARVYVVQYKTGSKHRRLTLGTTGTLRLEAARALAAELLAKVRIGRDPAGEKAEMRLRASNTLGAAIRTYLARQKTRLRPRSYTASEHYLQESFKQLHDLPIASVDRRVVATRLAEIAATSGPSAADRARATLSALFAWALWEGLTDTNPALATNRRTSGKGRERVLADDELAAVWNAAGSRAGLYGVIVKLLILTGQRREEIGGLQWDEIDFAAGMIRLPAARTKNGKPHDVPLSAPAARLLQAIPRIGPALFSAGGASFAGYSIPKRLLDQRIAAARQAAGADPMPPWVLHDLRRSVATHMAELGVAPHIVEALLNHVSGHKRGVAGVYNKAVYAVEKRSALLRWAERVMAVVEGRASNVVQMPTRA